MSSTNFEMKSVNVQISDKEFKKHGLTKDSVSFSELMLIISKQIAKENLKACLEFSEKYGLSKMTMKEINSEIREERDAASNS